MNHPCLRLIHLCETNVFQVCLCLQDILVVPCSINSIPTLMEQQLTFSLCQLNPLMDQIHLVINLSVDKQAFSQTLSQSYKNAFSQELGVDSGDVYITGITEAVRVSVRSADQSVLATSIDVETSVLSAAGTGASVHASISSGTALIDAVETSTGVNAQIVGSVTLELATQQVLILMILLYRPQLLTHD